MADAVNLTPRVVADLKAMWLERAKATGLPAKGKRRDAAALEFAAGAATAAEALRHHLKDDHRADLTALAFLVSVRGARVLES